MIGQMDFVVWDLLYGYEVEVLIMFYIIIEEDVQGLVDNIFVDYVLKVVMILQGYISILEKLVECFYMDDKFLVKLNFGLEFMLGMMIVVMKFVKFICVIVICIIVDKEICCVVVYDVRGNMVVDYLVIVGLLDMFLLYGMYVVNVVVLNLIYIYNFKWNFKQGENDCVLVVFFGLNGFVGNVWIDLFELIYGIYGMVILLCLFVNQLYGCVCLMNWDVYELVYMVKVKVIMVEFLDFGVSIVDVMQYQVVFVVVQVLVQDVIFLGCLLICLVGVLVCVVVEILFVEVGVVISVVVIVVIFDFVVVLVIDVVVVQVLMLDVVFVLIVEILFIFGLVLEGEMLSEVLVWVEVFVDEMIV